MRRATDACTCIFIILPLSILWISIAAVFFVTSPALSPTVPTVCTCGPWKFDSRGCCPRAAVITDKTHSNLTQSRDCDVDVRDASNLSVEEFQWKYVRGLEPVLITGLADGSTEGLERWAALDTWTTDGYLPRLMAAEKHKPHVRVTEANDNHRVDRTYPQILNPCRFGFTAR